MGGFLRNGFGVMAGTVAFAVPAGGTLWLRLRILVDDLNGLSQEKQGL